MKCSCSSKLLIVLFAIGVVLLITGCLVGFLLFPYLLETIVAQNVELREGTVQWDRFKVIPLPFDFKVTFFTITNPEETLKGAKPIVEPKGPYVYTERRTKIDTVIKGDEASYKDSVTFKFNSEASSPLTEDDVVHVINVPVIAIMQTLEDIDLALPGDSKTIIDEMFEDSKIFTTLKVADYTFKGLKMCDPTRGTKFTSKLICLAAMVMNLRTLKYNEDRSMTFSLLYYKTLLDGPFTANTGTEDINKLGILTSYKGRKYTEFWKGKESSCDAVGGHVTTFTPFIKSEGKLNIYSSDICKTATLNFKEESSVKDVDTYKYQMTRNSFATDEQRDTCVCIDRTKGLDGKEHCYNDAVMDLNTCLGAPIIISFPHLMWTKKEYQDSIGGLNTAEAEANSDKFTTQVQFQPHTGYPIKVGLNIQMNMILRPMRFNNDLISGTELLRPAMFPMIWVQENAELTDELIQELRDQLLTNLVLMDVATWGIIGIALVVILVTTGFLVYKYIKRSRDGHLVLA